MYERILVPTDGSEEAQVAISHALEIAQRFGSTVHGIHVTDEQGLRRASETVGVLSRDSAERQEIEQRQREAGSQLTEAIAERAREAGLDVETEVISGDPADVITDYAEAEAIDLIVLGARGRSAVGKFLIGDVAGKVARHATRPVMLVRADE
jgi:nucleotide-binding universal stress UspA family protein